ncbi:MAG: alpha/beta hydrolase [Candidatus Thermoplasmatota archaeon]|nr:alpha/beta hydrolase [Candidatus Thermoplasmatota archaeon]MBU1941123.1 alpha/beta hydrolase [Candidatus Thermoplasmatota archaeon]
MEKSFENEKKNIYYIHGYQSSPCSTKAQVFQKKLCAHAIQYRDVPPEQLVISDCLKRIHKIIQFDQNVILIGSSLGGFLAAMTALTHRNVQQLFLLNPAIMPPGTDITKISSMPQRILKDMYESLLFSQNIDADIFIFRGSNDEIVADPWVLEFAKAQEAVIFFIKDDHRFTKYLARVTELISHYLQK